MRVLKIRFPVWFLLVFATVSGAALVIVRYNRFTGAYSLYAPPSDSWGSGQYEILDFQDDGFGWIRLSWGAKVRIPFQWGASKGEIIIRPYRPPEDGWMPWCAVGDHRFRFAFKGGTLRLLGVTSVGGSTQLDESLRKNGRIYSKRLVPIYDWK